jgi:hypothetical protein
MRVGRNAFRYVAGLALIALAAGVVSATRPDSVAFPEAARSFTFALDRRSDHLWIGVRSEQPKPSQLTVVLAESQASFVHPGRTAVYRLALGERRTEQVVRIDVDPPAAVTRVEATVQRPRTPELDWQPASPPLMLPPPRPASTDRPTAEASVDETDTYGLRLFGVPIRAEPRVDAVLVATASHGQRLQATCWTTGDVVTNGFPTQSAGAYTSDVWFRVVTGRTPGFIPDVRFARRGDSDRLNLAMCTG